MNPIPPACASAIAILGDDTASMIALHSGRAIRNGASAPTGCRTSGADRLTFAGVQLLARQPGYQQVLIQRSRDLVKDPHVPSAESDREPHPCRHAQPWPDVQPVGTTRPVKCRYGDAQCKTGAIAAWAEPAAQQGPGWLLNGLRSILPGQILLHCREAGAAGSPPCCPAARLLDPAVLGSASLMPNRGVARRRLSWLALRLAGKRSLLRHRG